MFKTKLIIKKNEDKILTTDEFIQRQVMLARIRKRKQRIKEKEELEKKRQREKLCVSDELEEEYGK